MFDDVKELWLIVLGSSYHLELYTEIFTDKWYDVCICFKTIWDGVRTNG